MKWSQTLLKTTKEHIKNEESHNAQLLIRAGYIDKLQAGVYTYLPFGKKVLENIAHILREELYSLGAVEITMPALHGKNIYEASKRWDSMDSLMRFTTHWTHSEYALGATHEEVITTLMKRYIQSYRDVPRSIFQIQTKFRDEKRAKGGLLRGREFLMKDMYSFHVSAQDLDIYYARVKQAYERFFAQIGIAEITYFTYASGGDYAPYSHEFQTLCSKGEDTIFICTKCSIAINKEIYTQDTNCPECGAHTFREERSIEVANIFTLSTRFSQAYDLSLQTSTGERVFAQMGCYGIGVSRLVGTLAEVYSDEKGLRWPKNIAPYQVHIVAMCDEAEDQNYTKQLYHDIADAGFTVFYDDRASISFGQKLHDADLLGLPIQIIATKKALTSGVYEVKVRWNNTHIMVAKEQLIQVLATI